MRENRLHIDLFYIFQPERCICSRVKNCDEINPTQFLTMLKRSQKVCSQVNTVYTFAIVKGVCTQFLGEKEDKVGNNNIPTVLPDPMVKYFWILGRFPLLRNCPPTHTYIQWQRPGLSSSAPLPVPANGKSYQGKNNNFRRRYRWGGEQRSLWPKSHPSLPPSLFLMCASSS